MKLPRDLSGDDLVRALAKLGYQPTRQRGSHIRLTRTTHGEQHLTVPAHDPLKLGTLNGVLRDVAGQTGMTREQLIAMLF